MRSGGQGPRDHRVGGDAGISIVEVLVAVTLLAVTMAATASSVIRSLAVARDSRESIVAANVVQYELERLRAIPFVDWVTSARTSGTNGTTTTTAEGTGPDGQAYEVTRQATWVQAGSATDGCEAAAAGGDGADYVRVSQTVTFPGRDIDPVTNVTIITPRLDFYDPFAGNLAVYVVDRDGVGAPGHEVLVDGPGGLEVAVTDADGCAFFPYLPVPSTGTPSAEYAVTIDTPGHVDVDTDVQRIEDVATVSAQTTTVRTYTYDRAATIRPRATAAQLPAPGCELQQVDTGFNPSQVGSDPSTRPTSADGTGGGSATVQALRCLDGGTPVEGWQPTIPLNLGWTLHQPALSWAANGYQVVDEPSTTVPPDAVRGLFPYADGYSVNAGRCIDADPTLHGAAQRTTVATDPGADVAVAVPMALVTIRTWDGAVPGLVPEPDPADVFIDHLDPTTCPDGERLYLGRTTAETGSTLQALVPYGTWVVFFDEPGDTDRPTPYGCGDVVLPSACVELRADTATEPRTGVVVDIVEQP